MFTKTLPVWLCVCVCCCKRHQAHQIFYNLKLNDNNPCIQFIIVLNTLKPVIVGKQYLKTQSGHNR